MFKRNKNKQTETVVEIVKTPKKETSFSIFQIIIFSFLFILMIWIIAFLSLELDGQKQEIRTLRTKIDNIENGGTELLESYIEKIKDLQKIDIKEQVQQFGMDIKENIQRVRELMFDKNDLAKIEDKITALEEYNRTYRGVNLLTLTSTMLLRDAINRGEPFTSELGSLTAIASGNPDTINTISKLEPYAKDGIKTLTFLTNEFNNIADDIVFIAKNPKSDTIRGRFLFKLKSLLKVRKIDFSEKDTEKNKEAPTADYVVNQIQKALQNNDLNTAILEYEKLKDISKDAFNYGNSWYAEAKTKLSLDEIIAPLVQYSLEKALHDSQEKGASSSSKNKKKYILPIKNNTNSDIQIPLEKNTINNEV